MATDRPFDMRALTSGAREHYAERSIDKSEEEAVKFLLSLIGSERAKWELLQACERLTGRKRLRLCDFSELFPGFMIYLDIGRVEVAARPDLKMMLTGFIDVPWCEQWVEAYKRGREGANGRPIGLLVPWPRLKGGLVLHNGSFTDVLPNASRFIHVDQRLQLTVEPWAPLAQELVKRL